MTLSSDTAGSQTGGPFSAQMLAPLFGAMPDGVAYCRMEYAAGLPQDCTVLYANAALYRLTGLSDVVGQRFSAVFPGGIDVREKPMSTYVQVVQTGQAARYERYLAALDKWFSVSVYSPNPDHFMLVFSDVSSQHAMEAQADRYAEWILDSVGEGLCRVDEGGVITFINPVGAQLLGYQPQEMLGQVAHTLFHHSYPDGSPYPLEACNGRAALAQNRPHSVDSEVFWRKDGSSFPVHYDSAPMRVDGRLRGTVLTFRDISAEVAIRRTLMDNQVKFRKAQEIAGFGSYVTDVESGHWEGSAQLDALLGLDADYPHSVANWTGLIDPEFRQPVLQHYADVLAGKLDFRMDYRIRRPLDGQHRWLAVNGELERDAQGKPLRLIGSVQDITERMQAKQELIALNASLESRVLERTRELVTALDTAELAKRSRGAFLANMSHEIRTPMNTVMGMVHLALKTQPAPPLRGFLEKIQQSGTHLLAMINDILDFSKIDAGKLQLENADFRVEEMLQHIIQLNEGKATEKGLSLRLDLEPAVPQFVRGDALRLSQILINFLNNAIKFTERGGIVLRVRNCEGAAAPQDQCLLRFEVQDTGIGLDEDQGARLFRSFEQGDNSTTRKFGGTGLGLAISRQLASLMAGEVGVSSRQGVGSTFWLQLRLEVAAEPDYESIPSPDVDGAIRLLKGRRVLVVDDNDLNLDVARGLLEDVGVRVEVARDGLQALAAVQGAPFDCVLMDVQMPGMDGLQATRRIRSTAALADMVVIAMTANAGREDRTLCLDAGMNEVVLKPVDPDILYVTLAKWMGLPGRQRDFVRSAAAPLLAVAAPAEEPAPDPQALAEWDASALARIVGNNQAAHDRLMAKYRNSAQETIASLQQCAAQAQWSQCADLAHKLKSSSRSVGAMRLGGLCEALEHAGRSGNGSACAALVQSVVTAFAAVQAHIGV